MDKDVYMKIASEMDDKDVLSMLSVNRKFNDPKFFRQIMFERYPLLIKYRKEGEDWKQLYLRMVTYILKLKEEYNFEYLSIFQVNPKRLFYEFEDLKDLRELEKNDVKERYLIYLGKSGDEKLIEKYLKENGEHEALSVGVIAGGHLSLLKKLNMRVYMYPYTVESAASSGNMDMIDYIESLITPENDYYSPYNILNEKRSGAIISGNLALVKKFQHIDAKYLDFLEEEDLDDGRYSGSCFDARSYLESGSFEVFEYTLRNACNYDDVDGNLEIPFIADEKIDWARHFINTYINSKFYNVKTFKKILQVMIHYATRYNATDVLKYLKNVRKNKSFRKWKIRI